MGVRIRDKKFWFNGVRKDMVWGRTSFKLANIVTYHYTGQGDVFSLGDALAWVEHNQRIFGEDVVLRVFLETAGWDEGVDKTPGNKLPNNGMFGSEPSDQGFWEVEALRNGHRETKMHGVGRNVLEWFYKTSQETGVAFELCIIATLKAKDNRVPVGEIDHAMRVTGIEMGRLNHLYPKALILVNTVNEWGAGSKLKLNEVNMWATRWYRDNYWPGVPVSEIPLFADSGGTQRNVYKIGTNAYHAYMMHPERRPKDREWWEMPDTGRMRDIAGSYPIGFNESMYYVEEADAERARGWYNNRRGWDADWSNFEKFYENSVNQIDYNIIHDEKGAGTLVEWPRKETRMEAWAKSVFDGIDPRPIPDPEPEKKPEVFISGEDDNGVRSIRIEFPGIWPRVVLGASEADAVREEYVVKLPEAWTFYAGGSFIGLDRGDVGEYDVVVAANNGPEIYSRSLHKEVPETFDAEDWKYASWVNTDELRIWINARTTGANDILRRGQPWSSRPHFGIRLWTYPEKFARRMAEGEE